jgi:hypothetical protein
MAGRKVEKKKKKGNKKRTKKKESQGAHVEIRGRSDHITSDQITLNNHRLE